MESSHTLKRIKGLCIGEIIASVAFIAVFLEVRFILHTDTGSMSVITLSLLIFILLQGSLFWFYLYRKLKSGLVLKGITRILWVMNYLNIVLLTIVLVMCFIQGEWLLLNLFLWFFALVEYINYFHLRLSYPVKSFLLRLRTLDFGRSRLYRELRR